MALGPHSGLLVADAIAEALATADVEMVFGVPGGGANLDLVGALEKCSIEFVLTHMETPAAIMAATYADLTGKLGACLATRGPGAASLTNGVAQAYLDRSPIIVVTDAISPVEGRRISRQRIDHNTLFAPITKWTTPIGTAHADSTARTAATVAREGRPGPVHLDIMPDSPAPLPYHPAHVGYPNTSLSSRHRRAAKLLKASRSPVIIAGMAAVAARQPLRDLVTQIGCRILTTYRAKGIVAESYASHAGLFTGGTLESEALVDSDLLILVGVDPVELIPASWDYDAPIISLMPWARDADYYSPEVEFVAPLEQSLRFIGRYLPERRAEPIPRPIRTRARDAVHVEVKGLAPHEITLAARTLAPPGAIATVDSGAHMLVAMQDWSVDEFGEVLISSGHATMAYALPAAIAAALVRNTVRVVCFTGDGGIGMALGELETAARKNLRITVVVFNDSALSLIEIKRDPYSHGPLSAVRYKAIDFARVASGFGVAGERATTLPEFEAAFSRSLTLDGPALIDVAIDPAGYAKVLEATRGRSVDH